MKKILVKTNLETGNTTLKTEGFEGPACVQTLQKISVGERVGEEHTDEYYKDPQDGTVYTEV